MLKYSREKAAIKKSQEESTTCLQGKFVAGCAAPSDQKAPVKHEPIVLKNALYHCRYQPGEADTKIVT